MLILKKKPDWCGFFPFWVDFVLKWLEYSFVLFPIADPEDNRSRTGGGEGVFFFLTHRMCACLMHGLGLVPDEHFINCGGCCVNKTELIEHIAKTADISKAAAARSLDAVIDAVTSTLKDNGSVTLVGFGTFSVGERAARSGRNPRTGEEIKIKSTRVPKFRAGKLLKDAVN